jgi:hypothetical protein
MEFKVHEKDREKVITEISEAQARIIQIFVPTILAVGLVSITDKENLALVTMFASFAILFGSSLYITNLSYKIFRNATFIRAVSEKEQTKDSGVIHWEKALSIFVSKKEQPKIIAYETKTIAVIFIVFALIYILMFYKMNLILSIVFGIILLILAIKIFLIPSKSNEYYETWKSVLNNYHD